MKKMFFVVLISIIIYTMGSLLTCGGEEISPTSSSTTTTTLPAYTNQSVPDDISPAIICLTDNYTNKIVGLDEALAIVHDIYISNECGYEDIQNILTTLTNIGSNTFQNKCNIHDIADPIITLTFTSNSNTYTFEGAKDFVFAFNHCIADYSGMWQITNSQTNTNTYYCYWKAIYSISNSSMFLLKSNYINWQLSGSNFSLTIDYIYITNNYLYGVYATISFITNTGNGTYLVSNYINTNTQITNTNLTIITNVIYYFTNFGGSGYFENISPSTNGSTNW